MHVANVGWREVPDAATTKFDVVVRQGTAGLQMRQTERFHAERGHSPAAFIGGTAPSAAGVYTQALQARKGRIIPTEWFLQDIRD